MLRNPDVLILGGGVIGLTVAYHLAREQVRVEVVDKGDFGQEASWAGAGMIPPGNPGRASTPFEQLLAFSSALFPSFSEELRAGTGIDNGYRPCGGIEILEENDEAAFQEWRHQGVCLEPLTSADLRCLEPQLAPPIGRAFHLPDMAQVRNPWHLKALLAACASLNVSLRPGCPVHSLECQGGRVRAALGGERLTAEKFVVTAGAWSDALLQPLGWQPGIHPVRGQIALLNAGVPLFRRVIEQGKLYLVPRPDGRILVGSTLERAGYDKRVTSGAIRDLLDFAVRLVPALADVPLERCWAGLRPGSPDGLPFLGPVPGTDNAFVAAGHFRNGIQLSPITGLLLKELLLGQPPRLPLAPFRLDRSGLSG